MNKIESFEIISVNPQVVKINEQLFYGFYLLEKDDKIINIMVVNPKFEYRDRYGLNSNTNYQYDNLCSKNFILCITLLNKCIRLFKEDNWTWTSGYYPENKRYNMSISNLKFNSIESSVSFIELLSQPSNNNGTKTDTIDYKISYDIKQHKYIISPEAYYNGYNKTISMIPLATNFTEMVSVNYNKDDDILSSYEKIKKENENIMNHLNSIVEFNKIKNDEIESLKIINKKHFESNFIELNKEIEHLRKENSNIIEIKKENDIMKQTISLQEIKINSCQNTISDLEKYIKQLENKLEEMNHCCFRCNDKYIKPYKKINCEHRYICNHCTSNICMCPKCNTMYG